MAVSPFLAEIRLMSFDFAPKGWALCDGQFLPINQNQALFALLGTTYGGNGQVTFALPDLRGRAPLHVGDGYVLGQRGGEAAHTLALSELPTHSHGVLAGAQATGDDPAGAFWASPGKQAFGPTTDSALHPGSTSMVGGSQAHTNMPPFLTLHFMIALQGVFPSQN